VKPLLRDTLRTIQLSSLIVGSSIFPANAGTTTADFLKWERQSQESFLQNSISMVGVVASQASPQIAECLNGWYFQSSALAKERHAQILDVMPQYAEYDPQAVILAVLEGACGKFKKN